MHIAHFIPPRSRTTTKSKLSLFLCPEEEELSDFPRVVRLVRGGTGTAPGSSDSKPHALTSMRHRPVARGQDSGHALPFGFTSKVQHTTNFFQPGVPGLLSHIFSAATGALLFITSFPEDSWVTDVAWSLIRASLQHILSICLESSPWIWRDS